MEMTIIIALLLTFIGVREWFFQRQIGELTSKLMARDYREYAVMNKKEEPRKKEKQEIKRDPVLGAIY